MRSAAAGAVTDYLALPLLFIDGSVHASSWTTKQPGGFTDEELAGVATNNDASGPGDRDHQFAPMASSRSIPMSATAPASGSWWQ